MEIELVNQVWFYLLAAFTLGTAVLTITMRNPVSCAMSMVASFVGVAALMIGLDAFFVGIVQIIVYAGAVMVLFLFIIMLLDVKKEEGRKISRSTLGVGGLLVIILGMELYAAQNFLPKKPLPELDPVAAAPFYAETAPQVAKELQAGNCNDVKLVGVNLFSEYAYPFLITGVILLSATLGVVSLTRSKAPGSVDAPDNK